MTEETNLNSEEKPQGCLGALSWYGMGFVLPCSGLLFYRYAARRKIMSGILFFILFTTVVTGLQVMGIGWAFNENLPSIEKGYDTGEIPIITITNGIASVGDAQQPMILLDEDETVVIVDTSGEIIEIDRYRYSKGLLLTKSSLHLLSNGRYREVPLSEINMIFKQDTIVFDKDLVSRMWNMFLAGIMILIFVFLILWNTVMRFMFISTIAVILWGLFLLFRPKTHFGDVLTAGVYAIVPVLYLDYLLGSIDINFFGLQTILLLLVWLMVLVFNRDELPPTKEIPLRGWRAVLGIPMLVVFALGTVFSGRQDGLWSWTVAVLTIIAMVVTNYMTRPKEMGEDEPVSTG